MAKPRMSGLPGETSPRVERFTRRADFESAARVLSARLMETVPSPGTAVLIARGTMPVATSMPGWAAACAGVDVLVAGIPRPGTGLA